MAIEPKEQKLIDAVNLIVDRLDQLPHGYELRICVNRNEAYLDLLDPEDNEIEVYSDAYESSITTAIKAANEHYEANRA